MCLYIMFLYSTGYWGHCRIIGSTSECSSLTTDGQISINLVLHKSAMKSMQQEDIAFTIWTLWVYPPVNKLMSSKKADTHAAMIKCLNIWKKKTLSQTTFMALLDILVILKKGTIAVQVCQYIYMKVHECLCVLP